MLMNGRECMHALDQTCGNVLVVVSEQISKLSYFEPGTGFDSRLSAKIVACIFLLVISSFVHILMVWCSYYLAMLVYGVLWLHMMNLVTLFDEERFLEFELKNGRSQHRFYPRVT